MIDVEALQSIIDERIEAALADRASSPVLLRVPEAAELLAMSTRTAYERISSGALQAVRDHGQIRVTREAVEEYAAACSPVEAPRKSSRTTSTRRRSSTRITGEWG